MLLASRPGELVTRGEIQKTLWGDGQFVDFEHAINTAVRKIRGALGDDVEKPRLIETLPRKGYRFVAPVEAVARAGWTDSAAGEQVAPGQNPTGGLTTIGLTQPSSREPADPRQIGQDPPTARMPTEAELEAGFALPRSLARVLFLIIQAGYLAMYCSTLYYVGALEQALSGFRLVPIALTLPFVIMTAMCGIAVRLYLVSSVGWAHPAAGLKFHRLFPVLLVLDGLWAASPLLATGRIGFGLALAGVAGLAYLPFSQRTLIQSIYRNSIKN